MNDIRRAILQSAIARYGKEEQINKAIEELSELIRALMRMNNEENIAE